MDIVRHLVHQNKRLREHGQSLREQVFRKENIYRVRIADKRHETRVFEEMIEDLEKSNDRLKDYYELYKGTGVHLDPEAVRMRREAGPAQIPAFRSNVYDRYRKAYPTVRRDVDTNTLRELVQLKTNLREKAMKEDLGIGLGDETKKMREKRLMMRMEKEKVLKDILALSGGKKGAQISLPSGASLGTLGGMSKEKLKEIAKLKLLSERKGKKLDMDSSSTSDSEVFESSSDSEDEDVTDKWKRMKDEKYKKLSQMSDAVESLHGDSPKEYRDRRKRRQSIEISKKNRNAEATAGQVEEITQRLKQLEERSAKVIAQKSKIDSLIEQHKLQQADNVSDE